MGNESKKEDFAIRNGSGLDLIIKERERQITKKGFTPEHDAEHTGGELAVAAACYAVAGFGEDGGARVLFDNGEDAWPRHWDSKIDKRESSSRIRALIIAGALIAAEIDRIHAMRGKS